MVSDLLIAAGGVGLFLVGMVVLTDSLKALAGASLRRLLTRVTRTPFSGALAGALATAVVQSSSATTVAAVGFVGAGLLTFPQAVGVIFGANIGTTLKGWLVALVGFKLDLALWASPLLLAAALLRLLGNRRAAQLGWSLAGLCILFLGIEAMKQGLAGFEGLVTPADFPDDTLPGRLQLVGIGVVITLVTQSSSAGVAMSLVALGAGTVSLPQAAAMVIGMDIGTTATALLATVGGSTAMRRTGYAHVGYNLLTGAMAFALLEPFARAVAGFQGGPGDAQLALVAFHTGFNLLGVAVALPFTRLFARAIVALVPEGRDSFVQRLDDKLLSDPAAALDAASATARDMTEATFRAVADLIAAPRRRGHADRTLASVEEGLVALNRFQDDIRTGIAEAGLLRRHGELLHALDHLARLIHRARQADRVESLAREPRLRELSGLVRRVAATGGASQPFAFDPDEANRVRRRLRVERDGYRSATIAAAVADAISAEATLARLDGIRWLHRVSYHLWRLAYHVPRSLVDPPPEPEPEDGPNDDGPNDDGANDDGANDNGAPPA
ncbi:MAG: Na/Pi cotransporter family protein [Alphaproteobacteria bacterium]|nr:Na/Pi cotransporter family protein [Alphaproteobacteria bacterium]MCB9927827.1 Na/Pi cotransporter family protein [Alphaproteobacteria bacterium]